MKLAATGTPAEFVQTPASIHVRDTSVRDTKTATTSTMMAAAAPCTWAVKAPCARAYTGLPASPCLAGQVFFRSAHPLPVQPPAADRARCGGARQLLAADARQDIAEDAGSSSRGTAAAAKAARGGALAALAALAAAPSEASEGWWRKLVTKALATVAIGALAISLVSAGGALAFS